MLASRGVLVDIRNPIVLVTGHTSRTMNQPLRRRRGSLRGGLGDRRRDPSFYIQDGRRRRWMGRSGLKRVTRLATLYMQVPTTGLTIRFVYCCTEEMTESRCTIQSGSLRMGDPLSPPSPDVRFSTMCPSPAGDSRSQSANRSQISGNKYH